MLLHAKPIHTGGYHRRCGFDVGHGLGGQYLGKTYVWYFGNGELTGYGRGKDYSPRTNGLAAGAEIYLVFEKLGMI